jgi:hypothetical protein
MPDTEHPIVVLRNGDTTFYLLPAYPIRNGHGHKATWSTVDGVPLMQVREGRSGGWWQAAGPVQDLVASVPGLPVLAGYVITDEDAVSAKFPSALTREQYDTQFEDDAAGSALYKAVWENGPVQTRVFPADAMLVIGEGTPAPDDGMKWVPNLPDELRRHPELWHQFPGHLTGFRDAAVEAIKTLPVLAPQPHHSYLRDAGVRVDRSRPSEIEVYTHAAYEPRQTRFEHSLGRNGQKLKRGYHVVEATRLEIKFTVSDTVSGATRAEAVEKWHTQLDAITDAVTEALSPAPCWHCKGTGVVSARDAANAEVLV